MHSTLAIEFQGWRILISPHSQSGWIFHCLPEEQETLTNDQVYSTEAAAVEAAKRFVHHSEIRLEIGVLLDRLQEEGRISQREYVWMLGQIAHLMQLCN